jgi:hypothetical protein
MTDIGLLGTEGSDLKAASKMLTCKFCHEELTSNDGNHRFVAVKRTENPVSVTGAKCNIGECLNRTGHLTRHHPDAPEWNGGVDYGDGRARMLGTVQPSPLYRSLHTPRGAGGCESGTLFEDPSGDA